MACGLLERDGMPLTRMTLSLEHKQRMGAPCPWVCGEHNAFFLLQEPVSALPFFFHPAPLLRNPAPQFPGFQPRYHSEPSRAAAAEYAALARSKGLTTAQLALAWCKSRWWVAAAAQRGEARGHCGLARQSPCRRPLLFLTLVVLAPKPW
jgi:hypothetical protein